MGKIRHCMEAASPTVYWEGKVMTDTVGIVKEFYDKNTAAEWERLQRHQFEFELTKRYINRYIKPGDKVLDIGGGPGRYSLYLAAMGCDVTLFDLSSANVEFAKEQANAQGVSLKAFVGDVREVDSSLANNMTTFC